MNTQQLIDLSALDRKGLIASDPIKSQVWVQILGFYTRKEAEDHAVSIGWPKTSVQRRFGRFEYKWVICDLFDRCLGC